MMGHEAIEKTRHGSARDGEAAELRGEYRGLPTPYLDEFQCEIIDTVPRLCGRNYPVSSGCVCRCVVGGDYLVGGQRGARCVGAIDRGRGQGG
jgi:hypothetical protein